MPARGGGGSESVKELRPFWLVAARTVLAWSLPFVAAAIQWSLWKYVDPFVWFFFYPVILMAPLIGGLAGGLGATLISVVLVDYVFMRPQFSFVWGTELFTSIVFLCVGVAFSLILHRLRTLQQRQVGMTEEAQSLNVELQKLINDNQRTQEALKITHEELIEAQRMAHVGHWTSDLGAGVSLWSEELFHIHGLKPGTAVPPLSSRQGMYTPETWSKLNEAVARALKTGEPYEIPLDVIQPDGSIRHTIARGERVPGETTRLRGTMVDVTELREAENAVRAHDAELAEAQRLAGMGSWTWDSTKDAPSWSAGMYPLFGLNPGDPAPPFAQQQHSFTPDSLTRLKEALQRALQEGAPYAVPVEIIRPNGEIRHMIFRGERVPDRPGMLRGTVTDITEARRAEAARAELEATRQKLAKSESLARLSGAVAHHFNNAMMGVLGNLEMAQRPKGGVEPGSELAEILREAAASARTAAGMSAMMLTYLGQTPMILIRSDVGKIAAAAAARIQSNPSFHGAIHADLPEGELFARVDPEKMSRMLDILLVNAWEARSREALVIRLSLRMCPAGDISPVNRMPPDFQARDKTYACLSVSDNGRGIEQEVMGILFDPFYTTKAIGRGVGLPIALGIIRGHHGAIAVESSPDRGSTFRVYVPMNPAA